MVCKLISTFNFTPSLLLSTHHYCVFALASVTCQSAFLASSAMLSITAHIFPVPARNMKHIISHYIRTFLNQMYFFV